MSTIYGKYRNTTLEVIRGTDGDDLIYPGGGWDIVDGRGGVDTVFVEGRRQSFEIVAEGGVVYIDTVSAASPYADRVQLINIEFVQFTNALVDLRIGQRFDDTRSSGFITGSPGEDTMVYSQARDRYLVEKAGAFVFVTRNDTGASDRLQSIERLVFTDQAIAYSFSPESTLGQGSRLVAALLGQQYLGNLEISGLVVQALEQQGMSLLNLAEIGVGSGLFAALAGSTRHEDFVRFVYQNVVGTAPNAQDLAQYLDLLQNGGFTQASLAVFAAQAIDTVGHVNMAQFADQGWAYAL